jgi:hypothetical protein
LDVKISQNNFTLTSGHTYTIRFSAKADSSRTIPVIIQSYNSPYTEYTHQSVNLGTTWYFNG